jgi:hypothetical protein
MRIRPHAMALGWVLSAVLMACGGNDDRAAEASFLQNRQLVTTYRQDLPEDFDPDAFVLGLGETFGVEGARLSPYQGDADLSVDLSGALDETLGSTGLDMQTYDWGFLSATYEQDPDCRRCEPSTVTEEEALARASELFGATGSLVGEFDWRTYRGDVRVGSNNVDLTTVYGTRLLAGEPTGDQWVMEFGNGDEVLRASGSAWQPIPVADVGLLTPEEALAQESARLADDVPVESIETAVLAYGTSFDRQAVEGFLVPVYRFPLNAELGLTTEVLAIRRTDLPG